MAVADENTPMGADIMLSTRPANMDAAHVRMYVEHHEVQSKLDFTSMFAISHIFVLIHRNTLTHHGIPLAPSYCLGKLR